MVEEHKERPMNEPGPLLQKLEGGTERGIINELLQTV